MCRATCQNLKKVSCTAPGPLKMTCTTERERKSLHTTTGPLGPEEIPGMLNQTDWESCKQVETCSLPLYLAVTAQIGLAISSVFARSNSLRLSRLHSVTLALIDRNDWVVGLSHVVATTAT